MIYNKRSLTRIPAGAVLVDRTTPYGNPCTMREATRAARCAALLGFVRYLQANPALVADIQRNLRAKDLVCWCAPLDCHAEVIQAVANSTNAAAILAAFVLKYSVADYRR